MHSHQRLQLGMLARQLAVQVQVGCCVFLRQQRADFFEPLRKLV
jgi:hypothetical protein